VFKTGVSSLIDDLPLLDLCQEWAGGTARPHRDYVNGNLAGYWTQGLSIFHRQWQVGFEAVLEDRYVQVVWVALVRNDPKMTTLRTSFS